MTSPAAPTGRTVLTHSRSGSVDEVPSRTIAGEVAAWLRALGVRRAFAMDSHHLTPLMPALCDAGIRIHMAASETGAGYMADGYARATGRLGVAITGGGPGLAMMLPALQTALVERVPLLAIVGQNATTGVPDFQETGPRGTRDISLLEGLLGGPKSERAVAVVEDEFALPQALDAALAALQAGGPAAIAIPVDIQARTLAPSDDPLAGASQPFTWSWHRSGSDGWSQNAPVTPPRGVQVPTADAVRGLSHGNQVPIGNRTAVSYRDLMLAVADALPEATIFVDAGQARHAAHAALIPRGIAFIDCPLSAPMGWAIAAAVGAGLAKSTRASEPPRDAASAQEATANADGNAECPVVCVTGDGSALTLGTEFATAVRYRAAVTFVLCENAVWGGPYSRHHGTPTDDLGHLPSVDWIAFAESMGLPTLRVAGADLRSVLRRRRSHKGPHLLVVQTPAKDDGVSAPYRSPVPSAGATPR